MVPTDRPTFATQRYSFLERRLFVSAHLWMQDDADSVSPPATEPLKMVFSSPCLKIGPTYGILVSILI